MPVDLESTKPQISRSYVSTGGGDSQLAVALRPYNMFVVYSMSISKTQKLVQFVYGLMLETSSPLKLLKLVRKNAVLAGQTLTDVKSKLLTLNNISEPCFDRLRSHSLYATLQSQAGPNKCVGGGPVRLAGLLVSTVMCSHKHGFIVLPIAELVS